MENETNDVQTSDTSTETVNEPVQSSQEATEVTSASNGVQAETTPPADELSEFKETVSKAVTKKDDSTETQETAPTDEPDEAKKVESEALSQEEEKVPEKLTERAEWQSLTKIADKVGKAEGKEARKILRDFYKREYQFTQQLEQAKPSVQVVNEMFKAVGGNREGFNNMRRLINEYDSNPANAVPMLQVLLDDCKKRAGMVLQSPELLTESQTLKKQLETGEIDQGQFDKRTKELLELEQSRVVQKRVQSQTQEQQQKIAQEAAARQMQESVQAINQAEESWKATKLKNDPDFDAVKGLFNAFSQQNSLDFWNEKQKLPNAQEAVEILERSLKQAKDEAAKFRPKQKAKTVVTGGSNGSSGNNRHTPMSELDEFKAEVEKSLKSRRT